MYKVFQHIHWNKVATAGFFVAIFAFISLLTAFLSFSGIASAMDSGALPTGGKVTSGKGSIVTTGSQMTVKQSTDKMIANWNTFNIGTKAGVTFKQPDVNSVALKSHQ